MSDYLPCPTDVPNTALDLDNGEQALTLPCRWVGVCVWGGAGGVGPFLGGCRGGGEVLCGAHCGAHCTLHTVYCT